MRVRHAPSGKGARCPRIFWDSGQHRISDACEFLAECETKPLGFSGLICAGPDAQRSTPYIPRTKTVEREAGVLHYGITSASHWSLYVKLQVMTAQPSCESVMNPHAYAECVPLKSMWERNQDIQYKKGHLCGLRGLFEPGLFLKVFCLDILPLVGVAGRTPGIVRW